MLKIFKKKSFFVLFCLVLCCLLIGILYVVLKKTDKTDNPPSNVQVTGEIVADPSKIIQVKDPVVRTLNNYTPKSPVKNEVVVRTVGSGIVFEASSLVRFNFRLADATDGLIITQRADLGDWIPFTSLPQYMQRSLLGTKSKVSMRYIFAADNTSEVATFTGVAGSNAKQPLVFDTYIEARVGTAL